MTDATSSPSAAPRPRPIAEDIPSDSRQARQIARRQLMAEAVMAEGTMRIEDLVERFGVSLMTAHRDLDDLESRGLLRKTRGIVSAAPTSLIESSDIYRDSRQAAEKSAIAAAAAQCIEPGQAVFLDDSTTVQRMVPHLPARVPLTAITNSIRMMAALKDIRDLTLLGLGGQFQHWCNAFMGPVTTQEIRNLRADLAFMSLSAITDGVVFHQSPEMVETKRAMFDSAARRILLADHTKFTRRALHAMLPLDRFDLVIVDDATPRASIEALRAKGIEVAIAVCGEDGL
ncbi:DeoR/GlpR family DNA-binding transcription regulator [Paracoccus spongiarum]|uniref:DeoR/GlpR family DNA-binding transcription regulator n=1 Tax=Paracoccus spongiarum TaxID=3064387 RepID=A0ABT9J8E0_9RHOB|nr:DeoR/GlpR family DNA-binding transcription regulator [Paracoccus sp. 2205BS29-5]MDP5306056.1 DeoR/GlpR family DNA-binding transcription regulator [Paracoccus sp. 2205BS29-5]